MNLQIYARFFGISAAVARDRADHLLEFARLAERADDRPSQLSGGMRRRLILPEQWSMSRNVLLDEPTTALDPQARHQVWSWLKGSKTRA